MSTANTANTANNGMIRMYRDPGHMYAEMVALVEASGSKMYRNFVGVIEDMHPAKLVVQTQLFPKDSLEFYTRHNLGQTRPESSSEDQTLYTKYYNPARGAGQGDYREGMSNKIENVVDCLTRFPASKRAILTVPFSSSPSTRANHRNDNEAKCLRELHFYLQHNRLHCTGFMRAQAVTIFPKNIHLIGSIMHLIARRLERDTATYTHFVTTLVNERNT